MLYVLILSIVALALLKFRAMAIAESENKANKKALKNVQKAKKAGIKYDTDEYYLNSMLDKFTRK